MTARRSLLALLWALALAVGVPAVAGAASPAPAWTLHSFAIPSRFSTEDTASCLKEIAETAKLPTCDEYQVTATNAGSVATSEGASVTLSETLPAAVTPREIKLQWPAVAASFKESKEANVFPKLVEKGLCTAAPLRCQTTGVAPYRIAPDENVELQVYVTANEAGPSQLTNTATVSGGGAAAVATSVKNNLGGPLPSFGVSSVSAVATSPDGTLDTQSDRKS